MNSSSASASYLVKNHNFSPLMKFMFSKQKKIRKNKQHSEQKISSNTHNQTKFTLDQKNIPFNHKEEIENNKFEKVNSYYLL